MLRLEDVSKWYGPHRAVESVSFEVNRGEIVGFLGPNGAGKSTVLRMLSTWLPPTSGRIWVNGHDVCREPLAVRRSIGYLPEHNALYEIMRVEGFLRFAGRLRGLGGPHLEERMAWVVERCGLKAILARRIQECSKGNRQRVGLAAALIHDPPVILLDEPTHGLDPLQVATFLEFLEELREGRAILFSNHILSELVAVSGRLLMIDRGRLLADVEVARLRERAAARETGIDSVVLDIVRSGGDL
jgi:ABC-2 type transport system ATP-binding protein